VKGHPTIERTLILVKPDGIARGLTGEILNRFERKGLQVVAAKMIKPNKNLVQEHYAEHKGSGEFFTAMVEALTCGPNLAVVLEGELAVKASRQVIGFASPIDQSPIGTIRGDFAIYEPKNLVHGSDSAAAAKREIILWFGEGLVLKKQPIVAAPHVDVTADGLWAPPKKVVPSADKPKFKNHAALMEAEISVNEESFKKLKKLLNNHVVVAAKDEPVTIDEKNKLLHEKWEFEEEDYTDPFADDEVNDIPFEPPFGKAFISLQASGTQIGNPKLSKV
jgi:nucleoside-diphosphate kinase